ncbi:MAG: hypothetical protein AAF487_03405 [Bacteroidota bacterium]
MKKRVLLSLFVAIFALGLSAQKKKKYDYGPDSVTCVQNISLYEENFKMKAYKDALPSWRKCIEVCPKARKSFYINGVKMYKHFIKEAGEDSVMKYAYVDTILSIYDMRIKNYGQKAYVLGRKGVDHFKYFRDSNPFESYTILKEAVELGKEKTEAVVLSTYYQAMYKSYREKKVEKADLFTEYLTVSDYISVNIKSLSEQIETEADEKKKTKAEKKKTGYEKAKKNLDEFFIKFAKCEDIVKIFQERIESNPADFELKKKALKVMNRRACEDSDFYLQIAEAVHAQEPSHESAYAIGVMKAKRKEISEAIKYFDEAVKLCDGCPDEPKYLEKAGKAAIAGKQYGKAKGYANKLLKLEPNNGEAIIIIGDAVRFTKCNDGKAGNYAQLWLAVDYYQRAKAKDSSVSEKAQKRINGCTGSFPETSEVFMLGIKNGDTYIHCNGESTKVRTR